MASPSAGLFGRERELSELLGTLETAERGRGGMVLLVGEPGIGKTALADEFARIAADRNATLAWGRAWEAGGAPPYWPWIEVLRGLPLDGEDVALDTVRSSVAVVSELVPELSSHVTGLTPPPLIEPTQARFRLFEAVTKLLRWSARSRPLVVVLDDLHAADPASLSLLLFASRGIRHSRVVLVGTFRNVEARLTPAVAEELTRIAREGRYLVLGRLERGDVTRWVEGAGDLPAELSDVLYAHSEGNPLFVVEMLRLLRAGSWRGDALPAHLPDGVREVIGARLRALPPESRSMLELGAVLGRMMDPRVLAAASGFAHSAVRDALSAALQVEALAPATEDRYAFTHILIRQVLYDELAPTRRSELHEAVARVLIDSVTGRRPDVGPPAPLAEIVHHLFEASPRVAASEAILWARRAARASLAQHAFGEAVAFLERALGALPAESDPVERCDVLLELSHALIEAGHGERGREAASAAADLARRQGDPERLARAALTYGEVFQFALVSGPLLNLLEEALAALPPGDGPLRARLLGRLASAKQPALDPEEPMQIAREAIAMARRMPDPGARLAVIQSATSALLYFAEPEERIGLAHELLELSGRLGDRLRALRGHLRLVFDYLEQGDAVRADVHVEAFEALAKQLGHPNYLWYAPLLRAARAAMRGAFAEAELLVDRSRVLAERSEEPNRTLTFAMNRLGLLDMWAQYDALSEEGPALLQVLSERTDRFISTALRASVSARVGRRDEAIAAFATYDPDLDEMRGRMSLGWLAEGAVALEDRPLAARVYRHLPALGRRNHCGGVVACSCWGPLSRPLGALAALLGRWDEAWQHFEYARTQAEGLGSKPLRARVELEYALGLLRRGEDDDRRRAAALLATAQSTAEELGLTAIAEKAAECLEGPIEPPAPRVEQAAAPVMVPRALRFELQRDGDYWNVTWNNTRFRIKDSRGLSILRRLVSEPEREFHVTDLLAPPGETGRVDDAGEVLDDEAVTDYRRRLQDLKDELEEAEQWNDRGRADGLRNEMEFLEVELSRAVGLGGRRRRAASSSERARVNARRRVLHAVEKLEEQCPELGQHLRWAVSTGYFCGYFPNGRR